MFTNSFAHDLRARVRELLVEKRYETDPVPVADNKPVAESGNIPKIPLDKDISFRIKSFEITPTSAKLIVEVSYGTEVDLKPQDKIATADDYTTVERVARRLVGGIWMYSQIDMNNARKRLQAPNDTE